MLCKRCLISKSLSHREFKSKKQQTYIEVDNSEKNNILKAILEHGLKSKSFLIFPDGNRYKIEVLKRNKRSVLLNQQYCHYEEGRFWPVKNRYVKIEF